MSGRITSIVFALLFAPLAAFAATDTVLLLHTNDLHDHVAPGYEGVGGLPYVAGYVNRVRAERKDVLLLDGGDVMEKGDLVAYETKSTVMYEAMGRIGYDAVAVGNHDVAYGLDHLRRCDALTGPPEILCVNIVKQDGSPEFAASKVFDVDGVRVGVIGATVARQGALAVDATVPLIVKEAERLEPDVDLTVVLCHLSSRDCGIIALAAPTVDVLVGGHTHEVLSEPRKVEETGAYIVQAGEYARWVGRLELTVDVDANRIESAAGGLVAMRHDAVQPDGALLAWVREREDATTPNPRRVVAQNPDGLGDRKLARLAAEAMRLRAGAEVGFCHPGRVLRDHLPKGAVDVNAVHVTGGTNGAQLVRLRLTGRQIAAYEESLEADSSLGETVRSSGETVHGVENDGFDAPFEPDRVYDAVMTSSEWETRCKPVLDKSPTPPTPETGPTPCDFSYVDAVSDYFARLTQEGVSLEEAARQD